MAVELALILLGDLGKDLCPEIDLMSPGEY